MRRFRRWRRRHGHRVSIHAPAWGATPAPRSTNCSTKRFNPRTRVGCDFRPLLAVTPHACFNPRTRVGCDAVLAGNVCREGAFQSTHPRGVRPAGPLEGKAARRFQSTHPRGVRHAWGASFSGGVDVSIHAPAWGATISLKSLVYSDFGFNPRTRVGCDAKNPVSDDGTLWFQSTHPRGVRLDPVPAVPDAAVVSIHAPAWGATLDLPQLRGLLRVSIHAPAWGATQTAGRPLHNHDAFQSTHPRGVRHQKNVRHDDTSSRFNPRTRVGCDFFLAVVLVAEEVVSIHAPAWGATPHPGCYPPSGSSFNPRTRVGCDRRAGRRCAPDRRFNPRTRVGCDILDVDAALTVESFNPRTRVGCDSFHVLSSRFP